MFMDIPAGGEGWFDPPGPRCKSCKEPIAPGAPSEELEFPSNTQHQLEGMSGLYHSSCAKPYASILRAMNMLSRFGR